MNGNGLRNFTFHTDDDIDKTSESEKYDIEALAAGLRKVNLPIIEVDKQKSALQEVGELLKNVVLPKPKPPRGFVGTKHDPYVRFITLHSNASEKSEFECFGTQEIRLTHTHLVKCRQKYNDIPVYGAQVTIEVDGDNELLAINSTIADSIGKVSSEPKIQKEEEELKKLIQKHTGHDLRDASITPTLYYYFDSNHQKWRLVYLVEKKLNQTDATFKSELIPEMVDYLIDAHTGELVTQLPRVKTLRKL